MRANSLNNYRRDLLALSLAVCLAVIPMFVDAQGPTAAGTASTLPVDVASENVRKVNAELAEQVSSSSTFFMAKPELDLYLSSRNVVNTEAVTIDDILFIYKSSQECIGRTKVNSATIFKWMKHLWLTGDYEDPVLGVTMLQKWSQLELKGGYFMAKYLQWVAINRPEVFSYKYVFIGDDDTFTNVPLLLQFLQPYHPDLNIMFGHLIIDRLHTSKGHFQFNDTRPGFTWLGLGGGAVFTRASFRAIAPQMTGPFCQWTGDDDVLLSRCGAKFGVAQVHSEEFDGHSQGLHDSMYVPYQAMITVHGFYKNCLLDNQDQKLHVARTWFCSISHRYGATSIPECDDPSYREVADSYRWWRKANIKLALERGGFRSFRGGGGNNDGYARAMKGAAGGPFRGARFAQMRGRGAKAAY